MADMFADFKKNINSEQKQNTSEQSSSRYEPKAQLETGGNYEYLCQGAFTMLKFYLNPDEQIKAESDAMVAMDSAISVEGKLEGGVLGGLGRMFSGEKFFFQRLRAQNSPGAVYLAPAIPGDIKELTMDGTNNYILQKDGFFAASDGVSISTTAQNLTKGLFSGEGFFVLKASGRGILFVSSYGAIHALDLAAGQEMIVDNAHLVAWPENMVYNIEKASSGWISSFTSGEGLVCRFRGPGSVLIQTRNPKGFGSWISHFLPGK